MRNQTDRQWPGEFLRSGDGITLLPVSHFDAATAQEAYRRTQEDGLLRWVFATSDFSLDQFARYFAPGSGNFPLLMFSDDQFAGYAWLNAVIDKRAFCHYCFFKTVWGRRTIPLAKAVIEYWLHVPCETGGFLFNVLIGSTPTDNRKAIRFLKHINFREVGVIPKAAPSGDAMISYVTRDSYYGQE